jgi:hypothetical protein
MGPAGTTLIVVKKKFGWRPVELYLVCWIIPNIQAEKVCITHSVYALLTLRMAEKPRWNKALLKK